MKTILLKLKLLFLIGISPLFAHSQAPATGPTIPNGSTVPVKADHAWYRGGNIAGGAAGNKNIFGFTTGNLPIYTQTNGAMRTKLNGTFIGGTQYAINGFGFVNGVNTSGYFLLGVDFGPPPTSFYNTRGAFSLLHLNGNSTGTATFIQDGGYRPWMKTGITFTDNQDRAYIGYRSNGLDISDLVINWSDNSTAPFPGPDNLIFNFSGGTGSANNDLTGDHPNGREIARMTGYGYMGIGPRFNNLQLNGQPQSMLHINNADNRQAWLQISNQNVGQTVTDGFRIGIVGAIENPSFPFNIGTPVAAGAVGTAMIYNQENRPLLFSVNQVTNTYTGGNSTLERVRIMALNTPTQLAAGGIGVYNPGGLTTPNITRMSISHDPTNPVTRPLSLLHLGYNTGGVGTGTTDGWRSWMNIGMFTTNGTDHVYIGLKQEPGLFDDRNDAVISWGDNQSSGAPIVNGPDKLRFIFTGTQTGSGVFPPANSQNGLEVGRFYPNRDTLGTYGRFGVGDFTVTGVNEEPTHKIDVVGNGRFRYLPDSIYRADNLVNKYVMVDSLGVLRWSDVPPSSNNIGHYCSDTPSNPLTDHFEIPLANFNYYFQGQGNITRNVGIGFGCVDPLLAKLHVYQTAQNFLFTSTLGLSTAGRFDNVAPGLIAYGAYGYTYGTAQFKLGGYFEAANAGDVNIGVYGTASGATLNYAGYFDGDVYVNGGANSGTGYLVASDQQFKTDIDTIADAMTIINQLSPKEFYFDTTNVYNIKFSNKKQHGFIAQEVELILPELVGEVTKPAEYDTLGNITVPAVTYKNMNYNALFAILTKGIQEQQATITSQDSVIQSLNDRLTQLENCINGLNLCNNAMVNPNNNNSQAVTNVELNDAKTVVLDQNVPNPFSEMTTITYTLNDGVNKAQILFYNIEGKLINSLDISTQSGKGQVNVFANDLSTGIYTYTLIVDGKVIDTKKMVKQ